MAGSGDVAMPLEASGVHDPVPDSPEIAANAEAGMAAILARLSSLEGELKKANEVIERMRRGEEEENGEDDEEEGEPSASMASRVPTVPESFRESLRAMPLKTDPPGLPVSMEPEYQQAGVSRYPEKSIHSADDPYYYTTPQKSTGAWDNWSQQGWADWKGGAEGAESHQGWADWKGGAEGAESLGDRWFQYKTDPWTEARLG